MKFTIEVTALRTSDLKLRSRGCSGTSSFASSLKYLIFSSLVLVGEGSLAASPSVTFGCPRGNTF